MFTYYMPTKVFFGKGCIAQSGEVLADLGRKALLVTGRHSAKVNGSQAAVVEKLDELGISWFLFDEVENNPSVATIRKAAAFASEKGVDFVLDAVLRHVERIGDLEGQQAGCLLQQPAQGAYGHVLVALDAAPAVPALLRYAGALEGSARVELFHACPVRGPCDATLAYRSQEQWRVRLSDAFEARRNRVDLRVGVQDLARQLVVQQERVGADLIVLGHRRRGLLAETLRGAVARRLLQGVRCDVLVVPHDGASQPQERRQAVAAPGWG